MRLSPAGVQLIEAFEGFRSNPYRDLAHVWTIGFGSTRGVGPSTPPVTREQAGARLQHEVDAQYGAAINALGLPLNQNQFDALVSFVYNVGPGAVSASTHIGQALRAHAWLAAADHLLEWNRAGGRPIASLTDRRRAERELFLRTDHSDPYDGYRPDEVRWIREFDDLRRTNANPSRCRVLHVVMTQRRKAIWIAAQPEPRGEGGGWDSARRRQRYHSLLARTR